jgi:hypothetical protein
MIKTDNKHYLNIEDYAKEKGKTIQTIYNWVKDKKVKTRYILGKLYIQL